MKTGRKPADMPESKEELSNEQVLIEDNQAANTLALANSIADGEKDAVLAAGIDIGRLEAMDFVATIATSSMLAVFENVKKSKAWKYLRNPKSGDHRHFESLEEFCEVKLGRSYRRVRELALNRNLIGQEAFEQAERLGLRQVDYNAIKTLPAPDQELVRRAVEEAQSREEVLDVLQELAGRFANEKASLSEKLAEAEADVQAKDDLLATKSANIDKLTEKLARIKREKPDDTLKAAREEAATIVAELLGKVRGDLRNALQVLSDLDSQDTVYLAGMVGQVGAELAVLREQFDLPDLSDAKDAALAAEVAQWAEGAEA